MLHFAKHAALGACVFLAGVIFRDLHHDHHGR